jgi:thiamine biosynthesis lipoprotein
VKTFRAMNTDVAVISDRDEDRIAGEVIAVFEDAERRFSRFRDDSELARLNRADQPMAVSESMFDALVAARRHVELTGGIFDPAIGAALVAAGYDRSFAVGALDREIDLPAPRPARFLEVELDGNARRVSRPTGIQIDLGGLIKGRTVDLAAARLPATGAIDAGGDAVFRGERLVDVEDPRDPTQIVTTLCVRDAAVATSAATRRKWWVANAVRHHLIDPRTQRPATTDLLQVTIVAATAELADVFAKTVFVLGATRGRAFLERRPELGAVLVPGSGAPIVCGRVELAS